MPSDSHVHSEWSWDARNGSMKRSCAQALRLGLPSIAFTEHLDHTVWSLSRGSLADLPRDSPVAALRDEDGRVNPPAFDVVGYLDAVDRCRREFPDLRILTGLEVGEPHWHVEAVDCVVGSGPFDRVIGSLHCLPEADRFEEPGELYTHRAPVQVMRDYLNEIVRLVTETDAFSILGHIDYPVRYWPEGIGPFDPALFEGGFRAALRATARSGRVLEVNTVVPLSAVILRWWHDEGGAAISFGSDAHEPMTVAHGFVAAAAMAEAIGFRPQSDPLQFWPRW
jgi:histidinol-phosphatase (PHP family)